MPGSKEYLMLLSLMFDLMGMQFIKNKPSSNQRLNLSLLMLSSLMFDLLRYSLQNQNHETRDVLYPTLFSNFLQDLQRRLLLFESKV